MNTELGFLMELFLDDELPKTTRAKIKDRIKEVEASLAPKHFVPEEFRHFETTTAAKSAGLPPTEGSIIARQAPSMQRLMQNNPDLIPRPPIPVTPAAAQALAARQALINGAMSEKPEPGRKSPRKI